LTEVARLANESLQVGVDRANGRLGEWFHRAAGHYFMAAADGPGGLWELGLGGLGTLGPTDRCTRG